MSRVRRLGSSFYAQIPSEVARNLLGQILVTSVDGVLTSGRIVEVELYLGVDDPACHAARGKTERNAMMFEGPGHCYVYLIYGMYHGVNVVCDGVGIGSGVLIRAVEPQLGKPAMQARRGDKKLRERDLARGPGRLCQAFGITRELCGEHFVRSKKIWIESGEVVSDEEIATSGRIGISKGKELPLRFYLKDNLWVSGGSSA